MQGGDSPYRTDTICAPKQFTWSEHSLDVTTSMTVVLTGLKCVTSQQVTSFTTSFWSCTNLKIIEEIWRGSHVVSDVNWNSKFERIQRCARSRDQEEHIHKLVDAGGGNYFDDVISQEVATNSTMFSEASSNLKIIEEIWRSSHGASDLTWNSSHICKFRRIQRCAWSRDQEEHLRQLVEAGGGNYFDDKY